MSQEDQKVEDQEVAQPEEVAAAGEQAPEAPETAAQEDAAEEQSAEAPAEPSLEDMVAQLQEDVAAAKDAALRAQADAQNVKRRAEQDMEKARKFALESFSKELMPVVDNLERALESTSGEEEVLKPIAEGVELTLKSFLDVMQKFHIEQVNPEGEPFDPNLHQAMSMVDNPDVEANTVLTVVQRGYTLNGRLVRPAMVIVSK